MFLELLNTIVSTEDTMQYQTRNTGMMVGVQSIHRNMGGWLDVFLRYEFHHLSGETDKEIKPVRIIDSKLEPDSQSLFSVTFVITKLI